MSDGLSGISKIFNLLAGIGIKTSTDMNSKMDSNGDGTVTKGEFRTFLSKNFQNEYSDSDLELCWRKLDTDTKGKVGGTKLRDLNALNEAELENIDKYLQAYQMIDEYVAELTKNLPDTVTQLGVANTIKASVAESIKDKLSTFITSNIKSNDLLEKLPVKLAEVGPVSLGKTIANEYFKQLLTDKIKADPDLKAAGYTAGQSDIQGIIDTFVQSIKLPEDGSEIDFAAILTEVDDIVNEFMDSKNPNKTSFPTLEKYGYSSNTMNSLQTAVVSQKIIDAIGSSSFDGLDSEFASAVQSFLNNKLSGSSYSSLVTYTGGGVALKDAQALVNDFKSSKYYQSLVILDKYYNNVSIEDIIGNDLGELSAKIVEAIQYGAGNYKAVVKDIADKVAKGTIENDEDAIKAAIRNEILAHLSDYVTGTAADADSLYTIYSQRYTALTSAEKSPETLQQIKQAALDYCNGLIAINSELKTLVNKYFGGDYQATISKSSNPSDINAAIEKIREKLATDEWQYYVTDPENADVQWNYANTSLSLPQGAKQTIDCSATLTGVDLSKVRYSYAFSDSNGLTEKSFNSSTGKLEFTAAKEGNYTITVKCIYGNNEIASRVINVHVDENMTEMLQDKTITDDEGKSWTLSEYINTVQKRGIGTDGASRYHMYDYLKNAVKGAITDVKSTIDTMGEWLLKIEGLSEEEKTRIKDAIMTAKSYYEAVINAMYNKSEIYDLQKRNRDKNESWTLSISYNVYTNGVYSGTNTDSNASCATLNSWYNQNATDPLNMTYLGNTSVCNTGVMLTCADLGDDWRFFIDRATVMRKILEFAGLS